MDESLEEQEIGSTIFPFLSVLCCVIGTMVLILIAGSLNAAGFINIAEITGTINAKKLSLSDLGKKKEELTDLKKRKEAVAKENAGLGDLTALRKRKLNLRGQKQAMMGRTANIEEEIAEFRLLPGKKALLDTQQVAEADRASAQKNRDVSDAEAKQAETRRDDLNKKRQNAATIADGPKQVVVRDEDVTEPQVVLDLAADAVTVLSDGLSMAAKGGTIKKSDAMGDDGFFEKLAKEIARPGNKRYPVLLVRPGAVELHDEAERRFRRWRVTFAREPVDARWRVAAE